MTLLDVLERKGNCLRDVMDAMPIRAWQLVEILRVSIRDNKDVPRIVGPPVWRDEGRYQMFLKDQVILIANLVMPVAQEDAKWTAIPFGRRVKQMPPPSGQRRLKGL